MSERNSVLNLAKARRLTPPVDQLGERAQAARAALVGAVSNEDLAAIMAKQVEKAKAGDVASAKFIIDQVAGKQPSVQVSLGVRGQQPQDDGGGRKGSNKKDRGQRIVLKPEDDDRSQRTVGETKRLVAKYLAKNGPCTWSELAENFLIEPECEDTIMDGCGWFQRCAEGWHVTVTGRQEVGV
jgi:hypothetical protein